MYIADVHKKVVHKEDCRVGPSTAEHMPCKTTPGTYHPEVQFFDSLEEAQNKGFKTCTQCLGKDDSN